MTKNELVDLLKQIENFFPGRFKCDDYTAKAWWEILKNHNFADCKRNLIKHVGKSEWPPTIANLIVGAKDTSRGYSNDLSDAVDGVKPIEEYFKEIERATGRKVIE